MLMTFINQKVKHCFIDKILQAEGHQFIEKCIQSSKQEEANVVQFGQETR